MNSSAPSQITIEAAQPDSADAMQLIGELDAYLNDLPYDAASRHAYSVDKLLREGIAFFVMRFEGEPVGCGGIKMFPGKYGEIKRMYVRPSLRGLGLGKAMLEFLADYVRKQNVNLLRLETGIYQREAIGLYERWGFKRRTPFGEYVEHPLSLYYEKPI